LTRSRDSVSEYVKDGNIEFPVFTTPSDSNRIEYNFRATPSTYVISNEGKIIQFWSGAYAEKNVKSIEEFFGVKLPGMTE
jgi:hypothetical protein